MSPEDRALEEEKIAAKAEKKKLKAEREAAEAMMTEEERADAKARRELAKAEAKAAEKAAEAKEKEKEKETAGAKAKEETKEETKEVDHRVLRALMDIDMEVASGRSMEDSADEEEEVEEEEAFEAVADAVAPAAAPAPSSAEAVKAKLMDAVAGTKRGLAASGVERARINELIATLEASNPTPSPTTAEGATRLAGEWKIAYTSASELLLLLASENLPGVTIGDITQAIDVVNGTVENRVNVRAPLVDTSLIAVADFAATSPKRIKVRFTEAGVVTPSIDTSVLQYIDLPPTIDVAGQIIDTTAASEALEPLRKAAEGALGGLAEAAKTLPPALKVPLPGGGFGAAGAEGSESTWLLTTYLDEDTRVARGDGGSVFVMRRAKEVASAAR
jgi:hypothetical protein